LKDPKPKRESGGCAPAKKETGGLLGRGGKENTARANKEKNGKTKPTGDGEHSQQKNPPGKSVGGMPVDAKNDTPVGEGEEGG